MQKDSLSVIQVRSILELSYALARQPSVLATQLDQLIKGLCRILPAASAFGGVVANERGAPVCLVCFGQQDPAAQAMFGYVARFGSAHSAGTKTFRGDDLFRTCQLTRQELSKEYLGGRPTAYCFRREQQGVICLAFLRDPGQSSFSTGDLAIIELLVGSGWSPATHRPIPSSASTRQMELLDLLKAGRSEKEAAREMRISVHTVHAHVKQIYQRFGVTSRQELLSLWIH